MMLDYLCPRVNSERLRGVAIKNEASQRSSESFDKRLVLTQASVEPSLGVTCSTANPGENRKCVHFLVNRPVAKIAELDAQNTKGSRKKSPR